MYLFKEGNDKLLLSKNDISSPTMHSESSSTTQAFVAQDAAGGNPMSWSTTQEVASWFQTIGCPEYIPLVKKKNLNGQLLVLLEDQELKDFGIQNSFHRKKILLELSNVKRTAEKKRKRDSQSRAGPSVTDKKKKSAMGQKESWRGRQCRGRGCAAPSCGGR